MSEKHKWWNRLISIWRGLHTCWKCKYHNWGGYGDVSRCLNPKAFDQTDECRELNRWNNCKYFDPK